jgi:hypothetical protein
MWKNRYIIAFDLFRISRLWHLFSCDPPLFATPSFHRLITNPLFSCYQFRSNPKARHDHGSQSCVKCKFIFMNCNNITMIVARAQRNFIIIIMRNSTVIDQIMTNYFLILNRTSASRSAWPLGRIWTWLKLPGGQRRMGWRRHFAWRRIFAL